MNLVLEALLSKEHGVISSISEIGAVGHRVLHGGEKFTASCIIDQACMDAIEENIPLGPLHNPANLMGIRACQAVMPDTPMVAVFDTAFHQTMPRTSYLYGVPYEYYEKYHIRRYGFHGTSHRFVSARALEVLGLKDKPSKIVICHLGNGSSLSACVDGKCFDTSMGLTPLAVSYTHLDVYKRQLLSSRSGIRIPPGAPSTAPKAQSYQGFSALFRTRTPACNNGRRAFVCGRRFPAQPSSAPLSSMATMVREMRSSSVQPSISAPWRMTSREQPAANFLSFNFFFTEGSSRSSRLREGRMMAAALILSLIHI